MPNSARSLEFFINDLLSLGFVLSETYTRPQEFIARYQKIINNTKWDNILTNEFYQVKIVYHKNKQNYYLSYITFEARLLYQPDGPYPPSTTLCHQAAIFQETKDEYKTKLEELSDFIRITLSAVHEFRPAGNVKDLLTHLGRLAYKTNFRA
jgi:hypothetical protein